MADESENYMNITPFISRTFVGKFYTQCLNGPRTKNSFEKVQVASFKRSKRVVFYHLAKQFFEQGVLDPDGNNA